MPLIPVRVFILLRSVYHELQNFSVANAARYENFDTSKYDNFLDSQCVNVKVEHYFQSQTQLKCEWETRIHRI